MIDRIAEMQAAVDKHLGNKAAAARELGIPRETLRDLLIGRGSKQANKTKRHLVIPDVQAKEGVPLDHLEWIGKYIAEKQPDTIIQIGDFADMPSLSSYDAGKKSFEGRRYKKDIKSANVAMELLCSQFRHVAGYKPRMVLTLGNHENRIDRAVECDPKIEGLISIDDLEYESFGWKVIPFLEPIKIDGIEYVHYATSGDMNRPASSAQVALRERQCSVVQGHAQRIDIAIHRKTQSFALFSGICYQHKEVYLGAQGNSQKPGIWMLNEVRDGTADLMQISLNYLRRRYG